MPRLIHPIFALLLVLAATVAVIWRYRPEANPAQPLRIFPPDDVALHTKKVLLHDHAYQLQWKMDSLPGSYVRYQPTEWYTDASATLRLLRDGTTRFARTLTKDSLNQDTAFNRKARMFRLWYKGYSPNSGQFRFRLTVCVPESDWCQDHCVLIDTAGNYTLQDWPEAPDEMTYNTLPTVNPADFTLDGHPIYTPDSLALIAWFGAPQKVVRPKYECGFFSEDEQGKPYFALHYPGMHWIGNGKEGFWLDHLQLAAAGRVLRYKTTLIPAGMRKTAFCNLMGMEAPETDDWVRLPLGETDAALIFTFREGKLVEVEHWTPC